MLGMSRVATATALGPAFEGWPGLREVYLDLPGHGDSPGVGSANSQSVLDAVCRWIDTHVEGSVLLAGCSYGGYLAVGIARQRPDLVRGLLLVCPGVRTGPADRDLPADEPPEAEPGWLADAPVELHGHLDRALGRRTHEVVTAVLEALTAGGPGDGEFQDALTDGPGYTLHDQEDEFTYAGPVAVVVGRHDRIVGYQDQFRALDHFPSADYSLIARAGHYLPYEQPESLRAVAQNWLRRCDA